MRYDLLRRVLVVVVAGLVFQPSVIFAQLPSSPATEEAPTSHVRVVRLSYVSGSVSVKRPGASDWEKVVINTPLQEGFELRTLDNSYAEAEFENGSTARVGELSSLIFKQLALDSQGDKLNRLTFERGYATFHFLPEHRDVYNVTVADVILTPEGKCEFRTDFVQGRFRLEVFHGSVQVEAPAKSTRVGENKTLEYTPGASDEAFQVRNEIVTDDWDKWTAARDSQQQMALRDESVKTQQGLYGWSDLDTYGEWANVPGSGYGWSPYVPPGWSPYSQGMWDWYPSLGWTWVSSEPWGWLPYHCGLWDYDFAWGWYWMPMGGCGFWSPALVSWFQGPGWIGWRPRGGSGRPARPGPGSHRGLEYLGTNKVTTVPVAVFQNRQMITPQMLGHVEQGEGASLGHAPPAPPAATGSRAAAGTLPNAFTASAAGGHSPTTNSRNVAGVRNAPAPSTVVMGGSAAAEAALLQAHEHGSAGQPLRVVMGSTLGGEFMMLARSGEYRGSAFNGPLSYGWSGGVVLPHGHRAPPRMSAQGTISGGHVSHVGHEGGASSSGWHGGGGGGGGGHFGGMGHSGGGGGHH